MIIDLLLFKISFPISKVKTFFFLPPLVGFFIALFCSAGGVTGAFLLLPFQISILNFISPSVNATNYFYNIISAPFGVYRYWKEQRFYYPLAFILVIGCLPGIILGYFLRITWFREIKTFKLFVGLVLIAICFKLIYDFFVIKKEIGFSSEKPYTYIFNWKKLKFSYGEKIYEINSWFISFLSFFTGVIGGIYGIGGGALMSPILLAFFKIPPYIYAGANLFSVYSSSVIGISVYTFGGYKPDWLLGFLFGLGGGVGLNLGARLQKYMPQKLIRFIIIIALLIISYRYIISYF